LARQWQVCAYGGFVQDAGSANRVDIDRLKADVSIIDAVETWCPGIKLKRQGRDLVGLSPFKAERTPSFTVDPTKGVFYCFATDQGGDAVRLVELLDGCDFATAARRLAERCLGDVPETEVDTARFAARRAAREREMRAVEADERRARLRRIEIAARIWRGCHDGACSLAETYLAARGIDLDALEAVYGWRVPETLRCHPRLKLRDRGAIVHEGPAMVGCMLDADGNFAGIHRTFLSPDGTAKARLPAAKLTLGKVWGSCGQLGDANAAHVLIGEGYETTLTVMSAVARSGHRVGALSAISLNNLAGAGLGQGPRHPLIKGRRLPSLRPDPARPGLTMPGHIKRVTILEDADGSDPHATRARVTRAIAKFRVHGLKVSVATPAAGTDFNDMVQEAA